MEEEKKFNSRGLLFVLGILIIIVIVFLLIKGCSNKENNEQTLSISIVPRMVTLTPGESSKLNVVTSTNTNVYGAYCTSSNPTVVEVNVETCMLTANSKGTATITAKVNGSNISAEAIVNVEEMVQSLEDIYVTSEYTIDVGKTKIIDVLPVPEEANLDDITYEIEDKNIATVDSYGVVKGVSKGTTTLIISASGITKYVEINVEGKTGIKCKSNEELKDGKCVTIEEKIVLLIENTDDSDVYGKITDDDPDMWYKKLYVGDVYEIKYKILPSTHKQEAICKIKESSYSNYYEYVSLDNCTVTVKKGHMTPIIEVCAADDTELCTLLLINAWTNQNKY